MLKEFSNKIIQVTFVIVFFVVFMLFVKAIEPLWMMTTLLFFVLFSLAGMLGRWYAKILTILGIVLYFYSWSLLSENSDILVNSLASLGILVWFIGGVLGFKTLHL